MTSNLRCHQCRNPVAAESPPTEVQIFSERQPTVSYSIILIIIKHSRLRRPAPSTKGGIGVASHSIQPPSMAHSSGYGTLNNSSATNSNGSNAYGPGSEEQPLLPQPLSKSGFRQTLMVNVRRDWADVVLLLCYIITGLLDSASISTWGSFVSMQTGSCRITTQN